MKTTKIKLRMIWLDTGTTGEVQRREIKRGFHQSETPLTLAEFMKDLDLTSFIRNPDTLYRIEIEHDLS